MSSSDTHIHHQVPWLSARTNECEPFSRFSSTRAYITQRSGVAQGRSETLERTRALMRASGYAKLCKFRKHRERWRQLERDVPLTYLDALGVDREVLQFTVAHDADLHSLELQKPRFPRFASARLMACVYKSHEFPAGTTEVEAIETLKELVQEIRVPWFINYPELLSVWVGPDGGDIQRLYTPSVTFTRHAAVFSRGGRRLGMVSV